MRKGRSYQRDSDLSTRSAEILDQHDIAFDLIHTLEQNPLPIRRDIKAKRARDVVSEIQRRDSAHALGREIQEPDRSRRGGPVNEVNTVRCNSPPGKLRLALEDAGGFLARGSHSPNRPAHHPHVEELGIGGFLRAEAAVFRNLDGTAPHGWYLPNLPIPGPIGGEIDPFAVLRPRRDIIFGGIGGEAAGSASISTDDEDVSMAFKAGIEHNGLAIG